MFFLVKRFLRGRSSKVKNYSAVHDLNRIAQIFDQEAFNNEFMSYLGRKELSRVSRINHGYTEQLVNCLDRTRNMERIGLMSVLSAREEPLSDSIAILVWLYSKAHSIELVKRPVLIGNSRPVVLSLRVLLQSLSDRRLADRLYDEVRDDLDVSDFNSKELKAFLSFLLAIRRYDDFIYCFESYGQKGLRDEGFLRNAAHVYLYMGGYEKLAKLKEKALLQLDELRYTKFLASLKPAALDAEDGAVLLDGLCKNYMAEDQVYDVIQLLYKKGVSYSRLVEFIPPDVLTDFQRLRIHEMSLEAEQEKMLSVCELDSVSINDFICIAEELNNSFEAGFENRSENEGALYNAICQLESKARAAFMLTESSFAHTLSLANEIRERIRWGKPTSFIRIGDGEALFLPSDGKGLNDEKSRERILTTWWGEDFIPGDRIHHELSELIDRSICSADIVGVVPKWRIFDNQSYSEESLKEHQNAFLRMSDYLLRKGDEYIGKRIVTSCHAHQSLIRWDLYREVFRDLSSVSVISCHDLSKSLLVKFGLNIRRQYAIPAENAYSARFSGDSVDEPMYPECMNRIASELEVEPGEVFLVAAGFVGKYFCSLIKEMGGIALDVGSAADYFMGHQTRVFSHNEVNFESRPFLIDGAGLASYPLIRSNRSDVEDFITTDSRSHRDITEELKALNGNMPDHSPQRYKVRLIGHPRCASGYVAGLLSNCGVRLGHEKLARDGICSWMHAVRDQSVPWGDAPYPGLNFDITLAYARSPARSIPSIAMENCKASSFSFRRYHIYDLEGVDIAEFSSTLERAIASYIYWYKIVLRNNPVGVIRVENVEEDLFRLIPCLKDLGFEVSESSIAEARGGYVRTNDSTYKFDFEKPVFSSYDWQQVSPELLQKLNEVARRLGYEEENH